MTNSCYIDNYLVQVDLAQRFSITNGSNYKLSLIDSAVPDLKAQALWSDKANTTLYDYGGHVDSNTTVDDGVWVYDIGQKLWQLQQTIIRPIRLFAGGAPDSPFLIMSPAPFFIPMTS
jgi:hypothetical protein